MPTTKAYTSKYYALPCDKCGAAIGDPCVLTARTLAGRKKGALSHSPHHQRRRAVEDAGITELPAGLRRPARRSSPKRRPAPIESAATELEKRANLDEDVRAIEEFLDWLDAEGYVLCVSAPGRPPLTKRSMVLIYEFLRIDGAKLERERRELLEAHRG